MSLQVWLPLNGDLHNQGLNQNLTISNHNATINNNGKIGKCYYFDGNQQWLQFNSSLGNFYNNDWSITCWIKPTDRTRSVILSEYSAVGASNIALELLTSGHVRVYWNGAPDINFTSAGILPLNEWTHLTVTKQNRDIKVYFNGEWKSTYTHTDDFSTRISNAYPRIGNDYRGNSNNTVSYQGYLNDFRMYNHCLSPKEVEEIAKGLILHYPLNQLYDNNIIYDTSGYCNNGTIVGDITTITPSPRYNCATNFINNTSGIKINNNSFSSILNLDFTFSFWIKSNDQGRSIYFGNYSKNPAFNIEKKDNNSLRLYWNGSPDIEFSNTTITNNEWVFITIVKFSTGTIKAYLNGVEKAATGYGFTSQSFSSPWYIGRDSRGDNTAYLGNMSDFRIYCTALSANQIKELYNTSMQIDSSGNVFARELVEL